MPMSKEETWALDPHTQAKHQILEHYLAAWIPILSKGTERLVIFDGFAGPGEYIQGERGSPVVAIDALINSGKPELLERVDFLFVEDNEDRRAHLENLLRIRYRDNIRYTIFAGTFVDRLTEVLRYIDTLPTSLPVATFAFLDPFGFSHTPMYTINELMRRPKFEVLITFMQEWINRFMEADYKTKATHYNELFGSPAWQGLLRGAANSAEREQRIHDFYKKQLHDAAHIHYVRSFAMQSERGTTAYYLFFGTNHPLGLKKMKEAMWRIDDSGTYQFSDRTDPNQMVLFKPQPDYNVLQRQLCQYFKGKTVDIQQIEDYVNEETAFISFKKEALRPLEMDNPPRIAVVLAPSRRKQGTYPIGTKIQFL